MKLDEEPQITVGSIICSTTSIANKINLNKRSYHALGELISVSEIKTKNKCFHSPSLYVTLKKKKTVQG